MSKFYQLIQGVGAPLLLVGAMLQITDSEFSPIIYTLGAVLFAYAQVMCRYDIVFHKRMFLFMIVSANVRNYSYLCTKSNQFFL